ncbi:GTPase, partial [Streptomyces sp. NPDC057702]|uniref:GTPase n=1 Tax=Streptomyces sp. NPDC057702 TaxID=3346221 RepID=UPI0036AC39A1
MTDSAASPWGQGSAYGARGAAGLRGRLVALREVVGLSRSRVDGRTLAEAEKVLDQAAARDRYARGHTVVALAGSTGSGKSTLFNALVGAPLAEAGTRRPTTCAPLACAWSDRADGLLDRLGVTLADRHRPADPADPAFAGLVLLDLPDHDSVSVGHRARVERLLGLVDVIVWVVDPEKYADAVLHERYLRPLAGYSEVMVVVLNQVDRLPGDAADQVVDDLRRLLDEDGIALGEHGEPGAAVLALSALTGEGVGELRETLGRFAADHGAAERRLTADVDGATLRLRPAYLTEGRTGLSERACEEFEDGLADAAGVVALGQAAERSWLREAAYACGTPWARLFDRRAGGSRAPVSRRRAGRPPYGAAPPHPHPLGGAALAP